ncbi:MAG: PRC-barrel domain-containing protein [Methanobacteriaceae archaeon]
MVEISNLYNLDIYTVNGQYVGRVADVSINIRQGKISKLRVRASEPGKKNVGIKDLVIKGLQMVPEEDQVRTLKETILDIDYEKVRAIGDIMLIDTQNHNNMVSVPNNSNQGSNSTSNPNGMV